jgi:hypothetical protein
LLDLFPFIFVIEDDRKVFLICCGHEILTFVILLDELIKLSESHKIYIALALLMEQVVLDLFSGEPA